MFKLVGQKTETSVRCFFFLFGLRDAGQTFGCYPISWLTKFCGIRRLRRHLPKAQWGQKVSQQATSPPMTANCTALASGWSWQKGDCPVVHCAVLRCSVLSRYSSTHPHSPSHLIANSAINMLLIQFPSTQVSPLIRVHDTEHGVYGAKTDAGYWNTCSTARRKLPA